MIGGEPQVVERLDPIFRSIAPGVDAAPARPSGRGAVAGRAGLPPLRASWRRTFCQDGPQRHRVRTHGRLRRGLNILHKANVGLTEQQASAESTRSGILATTSTTCPSPSRRSVAAGSVVASWLLDLTAGALLRSPELADLAGRVSDSGRVAGPRSPPSTRASRHVLTAASMSASAHAARPTLPTACCRRCAASSAATRSSPPRSSAHGDRALPILIAADPR